MESFKDTQRQIRVALIGMVILFTIGVVGFMLIEGLTFEQALWLTTMTLTTVGYGDLTAETTAGHFFTIVLILTGFGVVAYGLQATATFLVSPEIQYMRIRRRTERTIQRLEKHYIICGSGDLVDQIIEQLLYSVRKRLAFYDDELYGPIDTFLDRIFGDDELGHYPETRALVRRIYLGITRPFKRVGTLLDVVVIVTEDPLYAHKCREQGFLVIDGTPTRDETLVQAGVERATAIMVTLPDDTDTLLTVLTARTHNADLYITAATRDDDLAQKALRIGANNAVLPFDLAGMFLNNVTLRPTVYDFFSGILFDNTVNAQTIQVSLLPGSVWVGKRIDALNLRDTYHAHVIGLRTPEEAFIIVPSDSYVLAEHETLIVVAPPYAVSDIRDASREGTQGTEAVPWQKPHDPIKPTQSKRQYTLAEAEAVVKGMSKHFIVCCGDEVSLSAIRQLDPERPFVIISNNDAHTSHLLARGFRVIHGDSVDDDTLLRAGVDRALAIMISIDDEADTLLTVIGSRALSARILITASANCDETVQKLHRAGADRVIQPFSIAAQFVLLSTTRPTVSDYFQHVLFNWDDEIETTELYMQDNSPWIGSSIADLHLERQFRAHVIGVRHTDGHFTYAPKNSYEIKQYEVLVVVTPMTYSDDLRLTAHGSDTKRPDTLRQTNTIETVIRQNPLNP